LPTTGALRAPDSRHLTLRSEISRESLAAAVEICVSTKKKNQRAWRSGALPPTTSPLTAPI
jgi:hypothetical protein